MRAGVVLRTAIASVVIALVVGAAFTILIREIDSLRESQRVPSARITNAVADDLERLVVDLETGVRSFAITGQERLLAPWRQARSVIPAQTRRLSALVVDRPSQARRVRDLKRAIDSYIDDYSVPLVAAVRRNRDAGLTVAPLRKASGASTRCKRSSPASEPPSAHGCAHASSEMTSAPRGRTRWQWSRSASCSS